MKRHKQAVILGISAMLISGLLNACSTDNLEPKPTTDRNAAMTPAESVTALYGLYSKTVEHLGEPGWQPVPRDATVLGVTPQACTLDDGSQGVHYTDTLLGPGNADASSAAAKVQAFWKSMGLDATTTRSSNPKNDRVTVTGSDGSLKSQYVVHAEGAGISTVTTCVPGDASKLIDNVERHRAGASATPTPPER